MPSPMTSPWRLGPAWHDEDALARAWREATPFPHLVIDELVAAEALPGLFEILEDEPVERYTADLYVFDATAPEPQTAAFRALRETFGATLAPVLSRITGRAVGRADLRAYAYRVGHYLLPHTDHQDHLARALAYAYYLPSPEAPDGGELELYRCRLEHDELVETAPATRIAPAANRLVVFDVTRSSLHQVREVVGGLRLSLSGWFYP